MQTERRTYSGQLLDVDFFPVFGDGRRLPVRAPKSEPTSAEQARYNRKMATRKIVRGVAANFATGDVWATGTFEGDRAPATYAEAHRALGNYVRRVRYRREKELEACQAEIRDASAALRTAKGGAAVRRWEKRIAQLRDRKRALSKPLKYLAVIVEDVYKSGPKAGTTSYHVHMFLTGGMDREVYESLWTGGSMNADRYRPEDFGPDAAATYVAQNPRGSRRFCYSKNLDKPEAKDRTRHVNRANFEKLCKERIDDAEYWERKYRGYRFLRAYARPNPYNGRWYLSVVMWRAGADDALPSWETRDWGADAFDF